jgi:hypothetical protein
MTAEADFYSTARELKRQIVGKGLFDEDVEYLRVLVDKWRASAQPSDIPDDYWPMLAQIESGNRPYVKAGSSSASGLYQFIRGTWIAEGGRWGADMSQAFGGLQPSAEEQLERAKSFTAKNANYLRTKGVPINKASLYAAHFFGAPVAAKVIAADVNARADEIAGPLATERQPLDPPRQDGRRVPDLAAHQDRSLGAMNILAALKGITGEFEIQRVLGAVGTLVYTVTAPVFVATGIIKSVSLTEFCLAYPSGLAACVAATAGAIALKDRQVAIAQTVRDTGAMPGQAPAS